MTIKDKKTAAILDNMQKVIEEERALAQEYKEEAESLREECRKKDDIIRGKEDYIRDLHDKLDKANSRAAVNKLLKCQEIGCAQRRPPLGEGAADTFKQIRNGNLGDEENGKGNI